MKCETGASEETKPEGNKGLRGAEGRWETWEKGVRRVRE